MIPKVAIRAFLSRELDSHLWIKGLSNAQLDSALQQLDPPPSLNVRARQHQKACFLLGVAFPQFCFWLDMGTGKTLLSLELLRYWFQCKTIRRAIIFVTSDKAFHTWEKQLVEFGINLPIVALSGPSEKKWKQLEEFGDGLVLLPYPGAVAMVSRRVTVPKKKKHQLQLDKRLVAKLSAWGQALVLDESTKAAGRDSLTHGLIKQLRKTAKIRYALAGRPFGRDPTMLWAQHQLIDDGETLGETVGMFRAAFFSEKENYWGGPYSKEYTFKAKMKPVLSKMAQHRSITYTADECIDLPGVVPVTELVSFDDEARAYYERLVKQVLAAKGNMREMKNVFLRMRQISSGFIGLKDDETGERAEIEFQVNPKLERLLELLEELPVNRKAVIFHEFTYSGKKITSMLRGTLGIKPIWLWSGTKDSKRELQRFASDPDCTVAVINNKVGAFSLDGLQDVANYSFFYESPLSSIDREQAERRLNRQGQRHAVFQYDLLVAKTVDERIRAFHAEGEALFDALLRNPARALGL